MKSLVLKLVSLFRKKEPQSVYEMVEEMIPDADAQAKQIIANLTAELTEKTHKLLMVERELKKAVKRKKPPHNPANGHVALVMFSQPKAEGAKVRMHTADNVQTELALSTVKRMRTDPDNDFIGAYFLLPMKGKPDAYKRLEKNAEAAWHLFQQLDKDLKLNDPSKKKDKK